jgi:hypothetical protein
MKDDSRVGHTNVKCAWAALSYAIWGESHRSSLQVRRRYYAEHERGGDMGLRDDGWIHRRSHLRTEAEGPGTRSFASRPSVPRLASLHSSSSVEYPTLRHPARPPRARSESLGDFRVGVQHRDRVPPNYEDARFVVRFKRQYTCRREYDEEHKVRPCGKEGPQDVTRMLRVLRVLGLLRVLRVPARAMRGAMRPQARTHARTRSVHLYAPAPSCCHRGCQRDLGRRRLCSARRATASCRSG